jgi:hypothetical protein
VRKACAILVVVIKQQGDDSMGDKVKIPRFIAEKISELKKQGYSLYQIFNYDDEAFQEYARNFSEQLMRALVDGYEVKKERLTFETKDFEIWGTTYSNGKVPVFKVKFKLGPSGMFEHYFTIHSHKHKDTYKKLYRDLQYLPSKE